MEFVKVECPICGEMAIVEVRHHYSEHTEIVRHAMIAQRGEIGCEKNQEEEFAVKIIPQEPITETFVLVERTME